MSADLTAMFVAAHMQAGIAARPRKVPRELPPDFIEADYASKLVAIVRQWHAAIEPLLADLPQLLRTARHDDTHEGRAARSRIERARTVAARTARVSDEARRAGRQATEHQKRQFKKQTKAALGVELPTQDVRVPTMLERFVEGNVSRITSLEAKVFGEVERLVLDAFDRGVTAEELGAEIAKRFGVAEQQARRIAGDQITKLTAQVRRERHKETGVAIFKWVTQADSRVRPSHAVKHGRFFPYKGSRAPSFFPGDEPNCRCYEEPAFEEIKARARELAGKGRKRVT